MDLRQAFRDLHKTPFIIPNPWDLGSAKILAALGFPALATTSAAAAQAAIVTAGRELLEHGTHDFWTRAVGSLGVVMAAMASED